nr:hypothetical protein [Mycobacterium sp. E136]
MLFFFLNLGNPILPPLRRPERESDHAVKARAQSTAPSSNTCWHISSRHARPVDMSSADPSLATAHTRPAASDFFHRLNAMIKSNPVRGIAIRSPAR